MIDLGRLRVDEVHLVRARLPLVTPIRTALGVVEERDVLLVRVVGRRGVEGWGECSAEATPGYWHEYTDACEEVLRRWVVPALTGATVAIAEVPRVAGWPMASAAVEWAVLDALCRREGIPAAAWLGGSRVRVEATLTLGLDAAVILGRYRHVKLKVAPGKLPSTLPSGVRVSADANGSLDVVAAASLAHLGLDHLEQPLAVDDLAGHARLRAGRPQLPIALDESIRTVGDIRTAAAMEACDVVVLKPGRLGGPRAAKAAHDAAVAADLRVKVGGMWDTGVGRAAALAVAALPGCDAAADLSASDRYFERDIVSAPAVLDDDGCLAVPTAPGLGIDVTL